MPTRFLGAWSHPLLDVIQQMRKLKEVIANTRALSKHHQPRRHRSAKGKGNAKIHGEGQDLGVCLSSGLPACNPLLKAGV